MTAVELDAKYPVGQEWRANVDGGWYYSSNNLGTQVAELDRAWDEASEK